MKFLQRFRRPRAMCAEDIMSILPQRELVSALYYRVYCVEGSSKHPENVRIARKAHTRKHENPANCVTLGWLVLSRGRHKHGARRWHLEPTP